MTWTLSNTNRKCQATQEIKRQMSDYKQELALLTEEIEENPPNALLDFLEADDDLRTQIEVRHRGNSGQ